MPPVRTARRSAPNPDQIEVVDWRVAHLLRRMTGQQRMQILAETWLGARAMIEQSVRVQNPGMSEADVLDAVGRRMQRDAT